MGFDFPSSPALNDTYAPVGGPIFAWDGVAWKGISKGAPVTVYVSDTAPLTPAIGQLWWNSATGNMSIWYADADSAQWVQVSGQVLPTAPSDGGEYVMVNGVWRLKSQSFDLTAKTTQDIAVPAWGPSRARLATILRFPSASALILRMSLDGATFPAGASDYYHGGFYHTTGSGISNVPNSATNGIQLVGTADNPAVPALSEALIELSRPVSNSFGIMWRTGYYGNSFNWQTVYYQAYGTSGAFPGTGPLKALRVTSAVACNYGKLTVDWLA